MDIHTHVCMCVCVCVCVCVCIYIYIYIYIIFLTYKNNSEYLENKPASPSLAGKKEVEVKDSNNYMDCK